MTRTPLFLFYRSEGGAAATAAGGGLALPWGLGRQPAAGELPAGSGPEAESYPQSPVKKPVIKKLKDS